MPGHLTAEILDCDSRGEAASAARLGNLLAHLRSHCPQCRAALEAFEHECRAAMGPATSEPTELYRAVFEGVTSSLRAALGWKSREPLGPDGPVPSIKDGAEETVGSTGRDDRSGLAGFRDWQALVDLALQEGASRRGEELAARALQAAEALSRERYGEGLRGDCLALTWATRARVRVGVRDWTGVEEALCQAEEAMGRGSGDPCVAAEIHLVRAHWGAQARGPELAAVEYGLAAALYREAGESHFEGEALLRQGLALVELGEPVEACRALDRGLFLFDAELGPDLFARAAAVRLELLDGSVDRPGSSNREVH